MQRKTVSPWQYLGLVIILGILLAAVGWWLISPIFIDKEVNEPLPITNVEEPSSEPVAEATPATSVSENQPEPTAEPATSDSSQVLAQGSFYSLSYNGAGDALVYQLADSSRILRLQDFTVDNGPDLFVYLVPVDPVPNTSGTEIEGYYNLGRLKGNIGDQNYDIPADLDLSQYQSVVIWCEAFSVPFIASPLNTQ
jgi:hypothetical protein